MLRDFKGEVKSITVIVVYFNRISTMISREKINEEIGPGEDKDASIVRGFQACLIPGRQLDNYQITLNTQEIDLSIARKKNAK